MTRRGLLAGVVPVATVPSKSERPKKMYATLDYEDLQFLYFWKDGNAFHGPGLGSAILSGDFDERGIEWR